MNLYNITAKKEFMNKLLMTDTFDCFLLKEATIKTANTVSINGKENKEFYSDDDISLSPYEYAAFGKMRPLLLNLIKGRTTPLLIKLVMYAMPPLADNILNDTAASVDYLTLTIQYSEGQMSATTAVAYNTFTLDKDADNKWDTYVSRTYFND